MKYPPLELLLAAHVRQLASGLASARRSDEYRAWERALPNRPDLDATAAKQAELAQQLPTSLFVAQALRDLEEVADIIRSAGST